MSRTHLLSLMILPLAASGLAGCSRGSAEPPAKPLPPAISVSSAPVQLRPMPRLLPLAGTLIANQQSEVAANATGRVIKTFVDRGSVVAAGAALVQLDAKSAQLSQTEALANLRNATTQEQLAKGECARNQALFKKGAISSEEWDRISSQCETSTGAAEAARARAELALKMLSDSTIRAPFAGMVGERYVSVGEYVMPPTKVVSLVQLDPLRLQLTVDEADIGQIKPGQEVDFTVVAYPGESFKGTLKYIDPVVRSTTRDLVVEALVPNPDHRLRAGMFATASLRLPDQPVVAIPQTALRQDADSARIFAVVDGRVEERVVQVGPAKDGYVAVLDGLKPGEQVVVRLDDKVKDGVPVL